MHELTTPPKTASEIVRSLAHRLKTEKALDAGYETIVHLQIEGEDGGDFTVTVANGVCTVSEGLLGEPKCVVKAKDHVYADIEWGRANPQMALFTGKVKVSNVMEMMSFTGMFRTLQKLFGEE